MECPTETLFNSAPTALATSTSESPNKWEKRFFWDASEKITLKGLGESFLSFDRYKFKARQDCYFLSSLHHKNVKIRREKLAHKPLLERRDGVSCYAKKQKFDLQEVTPELLALFPHLAEWDQKSSIKETLLKNTPSVLIQKEAFIYVFKHDFWGKFELSRLWVKGRPFLSFCLEAREKKIVQDLTDQILPGQTPMDYIHFLKGLSA